MAGRPITAPHPGGPGMPQDRLWTEIRRRNEAGEPITVFLTATSAKVTEKTARDYLRRLIAGGYLAADEEPGVPIVHRQHRLIRDTGRETPRLCRDGSPSRQGSGNEAMWRTLKYLSGPMSAKDLAVNASTEETPISEATAKTYLDYLTRGGYCIRLNTKRTGKAKPPPQWRFNPKANTGPKPPRIQRTRCLVDGNTGRVMWTATPRGAA